MKLIKSKLQQIIKEELRLYEEGSEGEIDWRKKPQEVEWVKGKFGELLKELYVINLRMSEDEFNEIWEQFTTTPSNSRIPTSFDKVIEAIDQFQGIYDTSSKSNPS